MLVGKTGCRNIRGLGFVGEDTYVRVTLQGAVRFSPRSVSLSQLGLGVHIQQLPPQQLCSRLFVFLDMLSLGVFHAARGLLPPRLLISSDVISLLNTFLCIVGNQVSHQATDAYQYELIITYEVDRWKSNFIITTQKRVIIRDCTDYKCRYPKQPGAR